MCEFTTKCYGMGLEGRGVAMMVRHKAERGPDVEGWDLTLVIDCTKEHGRLQELIGHQLAKDRQVNRPDLGKGVESGACWDLGVYLSEIGKLDAKPSTKQRNKYALNLQNKDGLESMWQHASNTQVDDGTGNGTKVRACVKGGRAINTGGSAKGMAKTGKAAKGVPNTGGSAKGMAKTGRAAKGAANWQAGVMQTPQEFLLALQQER
jgi:hypothetical protein